MLSLLARTQRTYYIHTSLHSLPMLEILSLLILGKTCLLHQHQNHLGLQSPVVIRSPAFTSTLHTRLSRPQCLCQSTCQTSSPSLSFTIRCLPSILASHTDSTISRRRRRNWLSPLQSRRSLAGRRRRCWLLSRRRYYPVRWEAVQGG